MKNHIKTLVETAIQQLIGEQSLPAEAAHCQIIVEQTKEASHGDYACNIALPMAKVAKASPRQIAEVIYQQLPASDLIEQIEIAGPGFINFFVSNQGWQNLLNNILAQGDGFGRLSTDNPQKIHIEFVSANPTGPLHVGHGRGAAYGSAVADLLSAVGHQVHREYYVNDAGRQMNILTMSVWLRYLALFKQPITLPEKAYQGSYVIEIAKLAKQEWQAQLVRDITSDMQQALHLENTVQQLDSLIEVCKEQLGEHYTPLFELATQHILTDIHEDLAEFGVTYQHWYSEQTLYDNQTLSKAINQLKEAGHTYEQEGNLWFNSSAFGDDKDRVLQRRNGQYTYFAADVAYHLEKLDRGFDHLIDIWGADHHGYIPRIKACLTACKRDPNTLTVRLVQFAVLWRGQEKISMSTRSGDYVTLRHLREEVGNDAARFFYLMRKSEQHLDFDLELAKSQSADNPVYYIQYAHARICSVFRQLSENDQTFDETKGLAALNLLIESHEKTLIRELGRYPDVINSAAKHYEPHQVAHYLRDLANLFHTYYNAHQFLVDDPALRQARLCLIKSIRQVLANGLHLLGISAPEKM